MKTTMIKTERELIESVGFSGFEQVGLHEWRKIDEGTERNWNDILLDLEINDYVILDEE